MNFQMFKLDLEKGEEPEFKLPTSVGSLKKQESSRKTSTSASLNTPKPLTVLLLQSHFSRVRLFATPWTIAHQAPPSMGFSRQEYWSGVPLPSPTPHPSRSSQNSELSSLCYIAASHHISILHVSVYLSILIS